METPVQQTGGLPRINEPAPDFQVLTTDGEKSLTDYRGKWLVLFSRPPTFNWYSYRVCRWRWRLPSWRAVNTSGQPHKPG